MWSERERNQLTMENRRLIFKIKRLEKLMMHRKRKKKRRVECHGSCEERCGYLRPSRKFRRRKKKSLGKPVGEDERRRRSSPFLPSWWIERALLRPFSLLLHLNFSNWRKCPRGSRPNRWIWILGLHSSHTWANKERGSWISSFLFFILHNQ